MLEIRSLSPAEWETIRDIRLRALQDSPDAFTSSYERESTFDEVTWRDRARTGQWFVAIDDSEPVGIACGIEGWSVDPAKRELVGMWVAESHRGRRVGLALLERVGEWARADGASTLTLGVVEGNHRALRAYEKMGLRVTGERIQVWNDPSRFIEVMERALGDS